MTDLPLPDAAREQSMACFVQMHEPGERLRAWVEAILHATEANRRVSGLVPDDSLDRGFKLTNHALADGPVCYPEGTVLIPPSVDFPYVVLRVAVAAVADLFVQPPPPDLPVEWAFLAFRLPEEGAAAAPRGVVIIYTRPQNNPGACANSDNFVAEHPELADEVKSTVWATGVAL